MSSAANSSVDEKEEKTEAPYGSVQQEEDISKRVNFSMQGDLASVKHMARNESEIKAKLTKRM